MRGSLSDFDPGSTHSTGEKQGQGDERKVSSLGSFLERDGSGTSNAALPPRRSEIRPETKEDSVVAVVLQRPVVCRARRASGTTTTRRAMQRQHSSRGVTLSSSKASPEISLPIEDEKAVEGIKEESAPVRARRQPSVTAKNFADFVDISVQFSYRLPIPAAERSAALNVLPPSFKRSSSSPDAFNHMQRSVNSHAQGGPTTRTVLRHSSDKVIPTVSTACVASCDRSGKQAKEVHSQNFSPAFAEPRDCHVERTKSLILTNEHANAIGDLWQPDHGSRRNTSRLSADHAKNGHDEMAHLRLVEVPVRRRKSHDSLEGMAASILNQGQQQQGREISSKEEGVSCGTGEKQGPMGLHTVRPPRYHPTRTIHRHSSDQGLPPAFAVARDRHVRRAKSLTDEHVDAIRGGTMQTDQRGRKEPSTGGAPSRFLQVPVRRRKSYDNLEEMEPSVGNEVKPQGRGTWP